MKNLKLSHKIEAEQKIWKNLKLYVYKNLSRKTLTKNLMEETDYMIIEREAYLKNIREE